MTTFKQEVNRIVSATPSSLSKCYKTVRAFSRVARARGLTVVTKELSHPDYDDVYTLLMLENNLGDTYAVVYTKLRPLRERHIMGYWLGGDDT